MRDPIPQENPAQPYKERQSFSPVMGSPLDDLDPEQRTTLLAHVSRAEIVNDLGTFIMEFQLLETLVKDAISFLLNKNDSTPGRIVTADMRFRTLLNVLLALFHHETRDDDKTNVLKAALQGCERISERRNALVHSFW